MKNQTPEQPLYPTADLGIAVYLFTMGHDIKDTTLLGPKRLVFHFQRKEDTEANIAAYLNRTGLAPAKSLFENYRALRAITFERTGNLK